MKSANLESKQIERESKKLWRMLAKHCGHKNPNYFLNLLDTNKHSDIYLSPREAMKHRLIDKIGIPEYKVRIKTETIFG